MFIEEKDVEITDLIFNYFDAVRQKWPGAWNAGGKGIILNKTNGFRALMRVLRPLYLNLASPGDMVEASDFLRKLNLVNIADNDFTSDEYKPGSSGESLLTARLLAAMNLRE